MSALMDSYFIPDTVVSRMADLSIILRICFSCASFVRRKYARAANSANIHR